MNDYENPVNETPTALAANIIKEAFVDIGGSPSDDLAEVKRLCIVLRDNVFYLGNNIPPKKVSNLVRIMLLVTIPVSIVGSLVFAVIKLPLFGVIAFALSMKSSLLSKKKNVRKRIGTQHPIHAEFLMTLFLNRTDQDRIIGDLNERYLIKLKRFGVKRARIWYRWHATLEICTSLKKWATEWGIAKAIVAIARQFIK
jgi:hypothetical protein